MSPATLERAPEHLRITQCRCGSREIVQTGCKGTKANRVWYFTCDDCGTVYGVSPHGEWIVGPS